MSKNPLRIDVMKAARDAQWSAQTFLGSEFIKLIAPAKVNLFLGVGNRLDNGYHEVMSVLHALTLHDVMYAYAETRSAGESKKPGRRDASDVPDVREPQNASSACEPQNVQDPDTQDTQDAEGTRDAEALAYYASGGPNKNIEAFIDCVEKEGLSSTIDDPDEHSNATDSDTSVTSAGVFGDPISEIKSAEVGNTRAAKLAAQDNIVFKAIDAAALAFDRIQPESISIRLEKNIPYEAGLGGGSSDAAATLLALAHFWDIDANDPALLEVARSLGSDVAFFLRGGCALYTGFGDKFDHSLVPMKDAVVLVKPRVGVPTALAYAAFDRHRIAVPDELAAEVTNAREAQEIPLYNNLAEAAEELAPALSEIHAWLVSLVGSGVQSEKGVMLCGSGATTFALTDSFSAASDIAAQAQARGWWAHATTFSSVSAAIVSQ